MFFEAYTAPNEASYVDDNVVEIDFTSIVLQLNYRTGANPVYFSFNGTDDHGVLAGAGGYRKEQTLDPLRVNKIWFRGGSGAEVIEVTALEAI